MARPAESRSCFEFMILRPLEAEQELRQVGRSLLHAARATSPTTRRTESTGSNHSSQARSPLCWLLAGPCDSAGPRPWSSTKPALAAGTRRAFPVDTATISGTLPVTVGPVVAI